MVLKNGGEDLRGVLEMDQILPTIRKWLSSFLDAWALGFLRHHLPHIFVYGPDRLMAPTRIRITDHVTGNSYEGENLQMNLRNTEEVDLEVQPKNRKGGPASGVSGSWTAHTPSNAFTVTADSTNPLKCVAKGDPNSPGELDDVGVADFTGTRIASDGSVQPVNAQIAINVLPAGAATLDIVAGAPREQV